MGASPAVIITESSAVAGQHTTEITCIAASVKDANMSAEVEDLEAMRQEYIDSVLGLNEDPLPWKVRQCLCPQPLALNPEHNTQHSTLNTQAHMVHLLLQLSAAKAVAGEGMGITTMSSVAAQLLEKACHPSQITKLERQLCQLELDHKIRPDGRWTVSSPSYAEGLAMLASREINRCVPLSQID